MGRRGLLAIGLLAALVLDRSRGHAAPQAEQQEGNELLQRMAHAYASCRSYRDSGTVRMTLAKESPPRVEEKAFRTAFVRPGQFRLDFETGARREPSTVWMSGATVRAKWSFDWNTGRQESLNFAVAGATGISNGAAHTVPALLLPDDVSGWRLTSMGDVVRLPDDKVGLNACYCIRGSDNEGYAVTVWLDQVTYLIRRIDEGLPAEFGAEQTTFYYPAVDEVIAVTPLAARGEGVMRYWPAFAAAVGISAFLLVVRRSRSRRSVQVQAR